MSERRPWSKDFVNSPEGAKWANGIPEGSQTEYNADYHRWRVRERRLQGLTTRGTEPKRRLRVVAPELPAPNRQVPPPSSPRAPRARHVATTLYNWKTDGLVTPPLAFRDRDDDDFGPDDRGRRWVKVKCACGRSWTTKTLKIPGNNCHNRLQHLATKTHQKWLQKMEEQEKPKKPKNPTQPMAQELPEDWWKEFVPVF